MLDVHISPNAGSFNDGRLAKPLYALLADRNFTPVWGALVADTAFRRTGQMQDKIYTPLTQPQKLLATQAELDRSAAITSIRQPAEHGMGALQVRLL